MNDESQAAVDSEQLTPGSIIFNIYIDISQAKFFLQSVNIGEGALGFSGGTAAFGPLGYGPGLDNITGFAVLAVCRLQYCCQSKNSVCRVVTPPSGRILAQKNFTARPKGGHGTMVPFLNTPLALFSSADCCSSHK
jgi:hypothetical protein